MTWHAEPIVLILRRYEPGQSYEARDPYASVVVAQLLGGGRAQLSGMLNGADAPISKADFLELQELLRRQHGVVRIESERGGRARTHGAPTDQPGR